MTQIVCRAHRPSQRFRTRKALSRIERHRHANRIGKRGWHTVRLALLTYVPPRFGVSSRQAKEQQRAKRVNIAADARLPKPILLGRRIGSRAKFDGVGIGAIAPNVRDPQVDNHQRREGHASIGRIPQPDTMMFEGLRSRWITGTPGSSAAAKPACSSPTASHKTGYSPRA